MRRTLIALASLTALTACEEVPMNGIEVREALDEAVATSKVQALSGDVVEITTDFTLGQAAEDAAAELRAWLDSQVDCATVTVEGNTVTVDFGELGDACVYQGRTYAGIAAVTIDRAEEGGVEVHHEWTGLTNGEVTLDGSADVTWSADGGERHIVHDVVWSDLEHTEIAATGDRTEAWLDGDWTQGLTIDGTRDWTGERGLWTLHIDGIEARWEDPVPQAGVYTLTNPDGKVATLTFTRLDDDTIEASLDGARRPYVWHVTRAGIEEVSS